jgi:site-specific DNA-methyltransferase (adenine-specific)
MSSRVINADFREFDRFDVGVFDLLLSDVPYALGGSAYGSNPMWYVGGDNANGESRLAAQPFFSTDQDFDLDAYAVVCSRLLKPASGKPKTDGCVITFCSFEQQMPLIDAMRRNGFKGYMPLVFTKRSSAQALKANMRYCGAVEYAVVSYRAHLPLFRNEGRMVLNWMPFGRSYETKLHPTQKPQTLIEELILLHTMPGMRVCDLTCGSGTTVCAAKRLGREGVGFEIDPEFAAAAMNRVQRQPVVQDLLEMEAAS